MRIETLLHEEIESEMKELNKMQLGSDEYKTTVDGLTKLVDKAIELDKFNAEHELKEQDREIERYFKQCEMRNEKKDRIVKNVLTGLGIAVPTVVTIWGTIVSLKFEETGAITSIMGRGFINKLLPKK